MSRVGNGWDNGLVESFFVTRKIELQQERPWATRTDARRDVVQYIEGWYNRRRRHSALGYLTPLEFEQQQTSRAA